MSTIKGFSKQKDSWDLGVKVGSLTSIAAGFLAGRKPGSQGSIHIWRQLKGDKDCMVLSTPLPPQSPARQKQHLSLEAQRRSGICWKVPSNHNRVTPWNPETHGVIWAWSLHSLEGTENQGLVLGALWGKWSRSDHVLAFPEQILQSQWQPEGLKWEQHVHFGWLFCCCVVVYHIVDHSLIYRTIIFHWVT